MLRAPVAADISNALPKTGCNRFGITAVAGSLGSFAASPFDSVALGDTDTTDLTSNGAGVSPKQTGYLSGGVVGSN